MNSKNIDMLRKTTLLLITLVSMTMFAQTKLTPTQATSFVSGLNTTKNYGWVSVHDPSVFIDNISNPSSPAYYVVGSFLGLGRSANLMNWTGLSTGTDHQGFLDKPFYTAFASNPTHTVKVKRGATITEETLGSFNAGSYCSVYADIERDWIGGNMWAPDMVYNPNMKKWCMYLSLNGDRWASVIVLLTADKPTGPFTYQAPIVFGGFNGQSYSGKSVNYKNTDLELVLGTQASLPSRYRTNAWGSYYPNCIDPCVFFDQQGELWMAYGSWSGGIFMLRLDKNTGLRDYTYTYSGTGTTPSAGATSDAYFGKKIAGGYYVSGEGPYIQYINGYYYLFMSYGFMNLWDNNAVAGGYEMRIFRSDKPDGPYKDASSNSAVYSGYQMNYGKNSATNRGMRIFGAMNGWGTMTTGECAQGHNSAIVDPQGNAFVVHHTKFNDGTPQYGFHQLRVRQLYQNHLDWLVASPFRHSGEVITTQTMIDTCQIVQTKDIAGNYKFIQHPYKLDYLNFQEATPVDVTLNEDGTITGAKTGKWAFIYDGKSYVKLVVGGITYNGVLTLQKVDGYNNRPAICFTTVSNSGVPVWLYKDYDPVSPLVARYNELKSAFGTTTTAITGNLPQYDDVNVTYYNVRKQSVGSTSYVANSTTIMSDGTFYPTANGEKVSFSYNISSGDKPWDYYIYVSSTNRPTAKGVLGDADGDGKVTRDDVNMVVNYSLGCSVLNINLNLSDVDNDGKVTMADANMILNSLLGR